MGLGICSRGGSLEDLVSGELTIKVSDPAGGLIRLDWLGKSNARHPGAVVKPLFDEVANEARAKEASIEMHFEALEHFNSSTITTLIQLIQQLRGEGVQLTIAYNGALTWQKLSFDALRVFEKNDGMLVLQDAS